VISLLRLARSAPPLSRTSEYDTDSILWLVAHRMRTAPNTLECVCGGPWPRKPAAYPIAFQPTLTTAARIPTVLPASTLQPEFAERLSEPQKRLRIGPLTGSPPLDSTATPKTEAESSDFNASRPADRLRNCLNPVTIYLVRTLA
jgi:hypothetical protein